MPFRYTHTHTVLFVCVCVCVCVWSCLSSLVACFYTCFAIASKWWWVSLRPNMCLCEFAQTLAIVPRVMRWIGILVYVSFLSQNFLWKTSVVVTYYKISNKNSQVVPKIFFCIFGFYFRWLQLCVCLCVGFLFLNLLCFLCFWNIGWVDKILVMQVVRVSTTDFGVMYIFNCAKLCQNMFQIRLTINDFWEISLNQISWKFAVSFFSSIYCFLL